MTFAHTTVELPKYGARSRAAAISVESVPAPATKTRIASRQSGPVDVRASLTSRCIALPVLVALDLDVPHSVLLPAVEARSDAEDSLEGPTERELGLVPRVPCDFCETHGGGPELPRGPREPPSRDVAD